MLLMTPSTMVNWGNPQVLTAGASDIILYGNPGKSENYVFRFKLPKNFEIKPFILNITCFLTVIDGEVLMGEGDQFKKDLMSILPAKSFCNIPDNYPIYFVSNEESILQFHGTGPVNLTYINVADDPRN